MTSVNQKPVTDYTDYRVFLADHFNARRAANPKYSLTVFGAALGMTKMAVKYLLDGERHLATDKAVKVSKVLKLSRTQAAYFERLVRFNKAKTTSERQAHMRELLSFRAADQKSLSLGSDDLGFFSRWFYPVIAEMSYLGGFAPDAAWIKPRLLVKVSTAEIEAALAFLSERELLAGGKRGGLRLKAPDDIKRQVFRNYALEQTGPAKDILESVGEEWAGFNISVSVDASRLAVAQAMIQEFRHKMHDMLANDDACDRVLQINMQMFTVAKEIP